MRKSELLSLVAGVKIQSKKDSTVYEIVGIDLEQGKVILDNGKLYTMGTIQRWYSLYEEEIPEVVEPDNTILDDIEQADELTSEQDTTADTEQQEDTDTTATNIQVNELHNDTDTAVKKHIVEGDTATTSDKITKDDIIYIIEHSRCEAVVKKQYIGAYKDDYKGTVCMVRTTKKGNAHIDMKQGIFNSLTESTRNRLEANYNAKVYDQSRRYIRLFEVDDLAVLQDLILAALKIA